MHKPGDYVVEDYAEPFVGYRWWNYNDHDELISPMFETTWEPGTGVVARCTPGHCGTIYQNFVVSPQHNCGLHAADSTESLFTAFNGGSVCGEIFLGGRTIKHTRGWRSETAVVRSLYLPPDRGDLFDNIVVLLNRNLAPREHVLKLAARYKVPTTPFPLADFVGVKLDALRRDLGLVSVAGAAVLTAQSLTALHRKISTAT